MTDTESALTTLAEVATREISQNEDPETIAHSINIARRGGGLEKVEFDPKKYRTRSLNTFFEAFYTWRRSVFSEGTGAANRPSTAFQWRKSCHYFRTCAKMGWKSTSS